jgi:hypothetical protein
MDRARDLGGHGAVPSLPKTDTIPSTVSKLKPFSADDPWLKAAVPSTGRLRSLIGRFCGPSSRHLFAAM